MTCYNHRSVSCSAVTRGTSSNSKQGLVQREPQLDSQQRVGDFRALIQNGMSPPNTLPSGFRDLMQKRRQTDCESQRQWMTSSHNRRDTQELQRLWQPAQDLQRFKSECRC